MAFTYDPTALTTSTEAGRRNIVRFLVGDTDSTDQQTDDDEVLFALGQSSDNVNYAAAYLCRAIASKYSRKIDTNISGALDAKYSMLQSHYLSLADTLESEAKKQSGLGFVAGGISQSKVTTARQSSDRVDPAFSRDRFWNPPGYDSSADYE